MGYINSFLPLFFSFPHNKLKVQLCSKTWIGSSNVFVFAASSKKTEREGPCLWFVVVAVFKPAFVGIKAAEFNCMCVGTEDNLNDRDYHAEGSSGVDPQGI
jgi:hypothetical protein